MKKFLSLLYTLWCGLVFLIPFLILFPFIFICIQRKEWHRFAHRIIRFWSFIFFYFIGMPIKKEYKFKPDKNKPYVFVANHFSYLDIAAGMNILDNYFAYVGKSSVKKAPLFGYMFAKLHIQVDRSDKASRIKTLKKGIDTIKSGKSVFIMPEGGILSTKIPKMLTPFKDGPFVMAVQNQVPIVPISYLNFYKINNPLNRLIWGKPRVIFNKPIATTGLTKADIPELKKKIYEIIQGDIDAFNSLESSEYA